ncbi:MAG: NAD-dependent epimerase/dehydratase family protein [Alphaproteobacteria bacterium]|nr:NAD-dependent epimerase/dehydratase family protein [Alphaproteobacteria bacterium]
MGEKLVTVFGGSGFLGRHVVRRLAKDGWRILVAVRYPTKAYFLPPDGDVGQIAILKADIRKDAEVAAAVARADAVINLVGILKPGGGQGFDDVHDEGATRIATLAAGAGVKRLVHISSIGADPESKSEYARTKAAGEAGVRGAFKGATVLRPSVVFGPEDQFFNRFASLMRMSPIAFPQFGGGKSKFQPVYVGDLARAVSAALDSDAAIGRTYELGGPVVYSFKELLQFIATTTERSPLFIPIPYFLLNVGAALTGWIPGAPITYDQAKLLRIDNIVKNGPDASTVGTLADLGVEPTAVEAVVPSYLWTYRPTGQYAEARGA